MEHLGRSLNLREDRQTRNEKCWKTHKDAQVPVSWETAMVKKQNRTKNPRLWTITVSSINVPLGSSRTKYMEWGRRNI